MHCTVVRFFIHQLRCISSDANIYLSTALTGIQFNLKAFKWKYLFINCTYQIPNQFQSTSSLPLHFNPMHVSIVAFICSSRRISSAHFSLLHQTSITSSIVALIRPSGGISVEKLLPMACTQASTGQQRHAIRYESGNIVQASYLARNWI